MFVAGPDFPQISFDRNLVNAAKSRAFGLELSVRAEPTERLSVFGSVAISRAEFIRFSQTIAGPGGQPQVQIFDGNQLADGSGVTAALGGTYVLSDTVSISVDASFSEGTFFNDADGNNPARRSDDRWLANAQLTYAKGSLTAGIFVRNVFDTDYVITREFVTVRSGEPRTFGVFVQQDF